MNKPENSCAVLIVDDEKHIRSMYSAILSREGHAIYTASCIAEACRILDAFAIDLVILDIKMPGGCGDELYRVIRMMRKRVYVLSASVFAIEDQQRLIPDADDFFDKSDGLMVLRKKVKNIVNTKIKGGAL
jgi:DNA-binding response OmpR family regulator